MSTRIKKSSTPYKRLAGLLKSVVARAEYNASAGAVESTQGGKSTSGIITNIRHIDLQDMPSSTVADHDGRYRTQAELSSTSATKGASMIGIEDAAGNYTGTTVEAALAEIAVGTGSAPAGATYVCMNNSSLLANERVLTAGEGIDLADTGSNGTVTINGEDATASNKGIASFDAAHFSVTSGAVSIVADGIDDTLIDWGTGAGQVNANDIPVIDVATIFTATDVENVLIELYDANLWVEASGVISPKTSTHRVKVDVGTGTASVAAVEGTTDDGIGVKGTSVSGVGVVGASTNGNAVEGVTLSAANDDYGGSFNKTFGGDWVDLDEQGSNPATPPSGSGRVFASTDGHCWYKNDAGDVYDMCLQGAEGFWQGQQLAAGNSTDEHWQSDLHGSAMMTADRLYGFDFATNKQTAGHGVWDWTIIKAGEAASYAGLAFGGQMPYRRDTVIMLAKVKVLISAPLPEEGQPFNSIKFYINSNDGSSSSLSADLGIPSDNSWTVVTATFDISAWALLTSGDIGLQCGMVFDPNDLSTYDTVNLTDVSVSVEWMTAYTF